MHTNPFAKTNGQPPPSGLWNGNGLRISGSPDLCQVGIDEIIGLINSGDYFGPTSFEKVTAVAEMKNGRHRLVTALFNELPILEPESSNLISQADKTELIVNILAGYAHSERTVRLGAVKILETLCGVAKCCAAMSKESGQAAIDTGEKLMRIQNVFFTLLKNLPDFNPQVLESLSDTPIAQKKPNLVFQVAFSPGIAREVRSAMMGCLVAAIRDGTLAIEAAYEYSAPDRTAFGENVLGAFIAFEKVVDSENDEARFRRLSVALAAFAPELGIGLSSALRSYPKKRFDIVESLSLLGGDFDEVLDNPGLEPTLSVETIRSRFLPGESRLIELALVEILETKTHQNPPCLNDNEFLAGIVALGGFAVSQSALDFLTGLRDFHLDEPVVYCLQRSLAQIRSRCAEADEGALI